MAPGKRQHLYPQPTSYPQTTPYDLIKFTINELLNPQQKISELSEITIIMILDISLKNKFNDIIYTIINKFNSSTTDEQFTTLSKHPCICSLNVYGLKLPAIWPK
jgi:hypothetical protein